MIRNKESDINKFNLHERIDYELTLHGLRCNINLAVDKFTKAGFIDKLDNSDKLIAYYELDSLARVTLALANYVELSIKKDKKRGKRDE